MLEEIKSIKVKKINNAFNSNNVDEGLLNLMAELNEKELAEFFYLIEEGTINYNILPYYFISYETDKVKNIEWVQLEKEALSVPCLILMKFNSNLENHVGVYIGEGKFIHCRNPIGVNIDRIESPAWRHRIVGFYRLKGEEDK